MVYGKWQWSANKHHRYIQRVKATIHKIQFEKKVRFVGLLFWILFTLFCVSPTLLFSPHSLFLCPDRNVRTFFCALMAHWYMRADAFSSYEKRDVRTTFEYNTFVWLNNNSEYYSLPKHMSDFYQYSLHLSLARVRLNYFISIRWKWMWDTLDWSKIDVFISGNH